MVKQYRERVYTDNQGNLVSGKYNFYKYSNYKTIELAEDLSLDEISFRYYGTPLYYWIVGEANNIAEPFEKLKRGSKVIIPDL